MATFFGEVLPITSRAVDLDDDYEDEETFIQNQRPVFHWSKNTSAEISGCDDERLPCSNLIIAIGPEANAFTEVYVKKLSYEIIGGVFSSIGDEDPFKTSKTSSTDKSCFIYRCHSDPSILICQCNKEVLPAESWEWTKLLFDNINLDTAYITILMTSSAGRFCSDMPVSDLQTPFLRALKTEKFEGTPISRILEQPNMLTAFPAQLMSFCQMRQYKAVIYVCYKDSRYVEIPDVKAFLPVLDVTPIRGITEPNKNAEQMLLDIVENHKVHDTLYM